MSTRERDAKLGNAGPREQATPLAPHRILPKRETEGEWKTVLDIDFDPPLVLPEPGRIVVIDPEPAFVGRIPIRTELTVLPADPPREPLGWVMREYNGTEVFKVGAVGVPMTGREDIQPGARVIVTTLVGAFEMTVFEEDGELWAESAGTVADLKFDTDDRHCWVSTYGVNKRLLR